MVRQIFQLTFQGRVIMQKDSNSIIQADDVSEFYKTIGRLGQGSFAQVFKVRQVNGDKNIRALKKIFLTLFEEDDAVEEVQKLKLFGSDHIIQYYECIKQNQGNKVVLNVIMNLSSGSLRDLLNKKKKFTPKQVVDLMVQITSSMLVLNKNNAMHLDLKPQNILYQTEDYFKICDFGCSKLFESQSSASFRELPDCIFGTARYISPEIKLNMVKVKKSSCDVWAFGIIIYEIIYNGAHPFTLNNRGEVDRQQIEDFQANKRPIKFEQISSQYPLDILKNLLLPDLNKRLTWSKIKEKLIEKYGRYQVEFEDLSIAFIKYKRTILIFTSVIFLIQKNIGVNPHVFWEEQEEKLKKLVNLLCNCSYLHGKLFEKCFNYKMKYKMSPEQRKKFKFYSKNFEVQQEKRCVQNNCQKSRLQYLKQKQNITKGIITQIYLKLANLSQQEKLWESMLHLKMFCDEGKQIQRYFCCADQMPKTCQAFQIQQD